MHSVCPSTRTAATYFLPTLTAEHCRKHTPQGRPCPHIVAHTSGETYSSDVFSSYLDSRALQNAHTAGTSMSTHCGTYERRDSSLETHTRHLSFFSVSLRQLRGGTSHCIILHLTHPACCRRSEIQATQTSHRNAPQCRQETPKSSEPNFPNFRLIKDLIENVLKVQKPNF